MEKKAFIEENFLVNALMCPSISGIMEKADNVYVSLGDFGRSDLWKPGDHFMIYQTETKKVTSV